MSNPRRFSSLALALVVLGALSVSAQDITPPTVAFRYPPPGASLNRLTEIQVQFSEGVQGVNAADLVVNNVACTNLLIFGDDIYVFQFAQPANGVVQVAFAAGHGIEDLAADQPNPFAGTNWTYNLDTSMPPATVIISEFLAANSGSGTNAIRDEDGDDSDWIEIRNFGAMAVSLDGWYLTDDTNNLIKWRFPNVSIAANGYLIVFASDKNRTNPAGRLHANFQLSSGGEYLALVNPLRQVASEFYPLYPQQQSDVSYGSDEANPTIRGYFIVPTPGAPNAASGPGFAPEAQFSRSSGTFLSPFELTLSTIDASAVIRYTTNDTAVATNSPLYTGPIPISGSTRIRARSFQAGLFPGPLRSESYVLLSPSIADFSSDLPVVILHTFGNGNISAGAGLPDTPATVTILEPDLFTGRTTLTNHPSVTTRAGINLRGSSTQGLNKRNLAVEYWDEANRDIEIETLGMPAESDWVLYPPNGFDHPLIHNPFMYEVSRQVGRYASRTRFVELFYKIDAGGIVSNNYFGVYVLTEKIKVDNNRVEIPNLAPEETNAPAVTGGYLFLINSGRVDANEIAFNVPPQGQQVIYQDPEGPEIRRPERRPQEIYITNYLYQMANVLRSGNADFTNLVTGYHAYIDVDSWIDHHILNVLGRNVDAIRLSGYFYKDRNKKIEFGPIWDFDRAMGTGKPDETDISYRSYNPREWLNQASGDRGTDFFRYATHQWWGRLFEDIDFWQRYIDRWQELRQTIFTTNNLFAVIDEMASEIREAQQRDQARWGSMSGANSTRPRSGTIVANGYTNVFDGTYDGEIRFLKRWLTERMEFVDTNFLFPPVLSGVPGPVSPGFVLNMAPPVRPPGSTIYYTLDGTDPRLPGGGVSPTALMYSAPITVTTNIRIFARALNPNHRNIINANCPFGGCPPISSSWSGPAIGTFYTSIPPLRITEIMYHPANPPAGNTNDADNFEYIEVRNTGATPLNVNRFRLGGGISFEFPNILLAAGQHVLVVKDMAAFQSRYPSVPGSSIAGVFIGNLANDGDHVLLEGGSREPILDFRYDDDWYPITDGSGFSLQIVDDTAPTASWTNRMSWRPSGVANGTPGAADPGAPTIPTVYVNEALTHTDPSPGDAIELYNPTGSPADIGGWYLTDAFDTPRKYRIPNGTTVPANGYLVFYQSNSFGVGPGNFGLNSKGDDVYLYSANPATSNLTGWVHGFDFGAQANGATFGRHVISTGEDHFPTQTAPTLGAVNSGPKVGPIVISEIHYRPLDIQHPSGTFDNTFDEYIELFNTAATGTPLFDPAFPTNTFQLRDAVEYVFPQGVTLPAGGYLLVVSFDPSDNGLADAFRSRNGVPAATPLYGPWQGKLNNSQDSVELVRPDVPEPPPSPEVVAVPYILVERVRYSSSPPWPLGADGIGGSLQRINVNAYGNDPANWVAVGPSPGAAYVPGVPPVITQQPSDAVANETFSATFSMVVSGQPPLTYVWRFNGQAIQDANGPMLVLNNLRLDQAGTYQCFVLNSGGIVASSNATLVVRKVATIVQQPVTTYPRIRPDPLALDPTNAMFSVAASSSTPISYQWRYNGVDIPGATGPTLVVSNVTLDKSGTYTCAITDDVATILTTNAMLLPLITPVVTQAPLSQTVPAGSLVGVSVTLGDGNPPPFYYEWRRGSTPIGTFRLTEKSSYLTFLAPTNITTQQYRLIITNLATTNLQAVAPTFNITTVADFDRDGLPDAYETSIGLNTNNAADALGDLDGDTMSNQAEYQAGTDPMDPNSYLRIDQTTAPETTTLYVGAVSNRTYSIQFANQLPGPWSKLADIPARPVNHVETVEDPMFEGKRFYRIVLPAPAQ